VGVGTERITVEGTDAALAAEVKRLLRAERLGGVEVAFLPARDSFVAQLWGLPTDPVRARELAAAGTARPVPVLRDDVGGVLVGRGVLRNVDGVGYCDDERVLSGPARWVEVRPDAEAGLSVRVVHGRLLRRAAAARGRAFQYGGDVAITPELDGIRRERAIARWTWYRHVEDLRLVRP
jgi:hypothetical protein